MNIKQLHHIVHIPVTELNMKSCSHARSSKHGERGVFRAPCTDLEMSKKGHFFHFNSTISHISVCFFGGPNVMLYSKLVP